jgi:hypothetical protein
MANYKHGGKTKKMADGGYAIQTPPSYEMETAPRTEMVIPPKPTPEAPPPIPSRPTVPQRTVVSDVTVPKRRVPVMPRRGSMSMMAEGGSVSSASKRADGCAQRGKTKGKMY